MTIHVYGSDNCPNCARVKQALQAAGLEYKYRDLESCIKPHKGWRKDGTVELMAYVQYIDDGNGAELPIVEIDGQFYRYAAAVSLLQLHMPKRVQCDGKRCVLVA